MTTKHLLLGIAAAVIAVSGFRAVGADNLNAQDRKFMEDAAKGGMKEVHMGHLGMEKGMSQGVKTFSQRLINDHTKANDELTALAKKKGVTLPADNPNAVSSMPVAKKSGADFDKAFAKDQVEDHQKDIAEFEKEVSSGSDPDVKNFASKTLPTLKAHLADAQALNK